MLGRIRLGVRLRAAGAFVVAYALASPGRVGAFVFVAVEVFAAAALELALAVALAAGVVTACCARVAILAAERQRSSLSVARLVKSIRLRRRVRRTWAKTLRHAGFEKPVRGGEPITPTHGRVRLTAVGVTTKVNVARTGATADQLRAKRGSLQSGFRAADVAVREIRPGTVRLDMRHTDPLRTMIDVDALPLAARRGFVVVGLDEDGLAVEKELRLPSLVAGAQGSGKSTEVWTTLYQLLKAGIPFRLRVFDPKGGQEFPDLHRVAYAYEDDPTRWPDFLGRALGGLAKRQAELRRRGIRNLTRYTDENPLDILVVDELVTVAAMSGRAEVTFSGARGEKRTLKAGDAHMLFLSQGRSAGYTELACTQLAQKSVIGPHIMDLFGYRTCLRVGSDELVDVILSIPGAASRYPAHTLDPARPGIGYVDVHGTRGVVKYRAAMLTEDQRRWAIDAMAVQNRRQAALREQLPEQRRRLTVVDGEAAS